MTGESPVGCGMAKTQTQTYAGETAKTWVNLRVKLPNEVGHGLAVDVARGRGEGRVDVGVRVHPHDTQVPRYGRRVPMDGANRQAERQSYKLSDGATS